MTEDPLFDPWSRPVDDSGADSPTPEEPGRSASAEPGRSVRWLAPEALRPVPARPTSTPAPVQAEPASAPAGCRPSKVTTPTRSPAARRLAEELLPAVRELAARLQLARHGTDIDDRTDRSPASIRFRVRPWRSPMDEGSERVLPVLELVEAPDGADILARSWYDPSAPEPDLSLRLPFESTDRRVARILIDFVEHTLDV